MVIDPLYLIPLLNLNQSASRALHFDLGLSCHVMMGSQTIFRRYTENLMCILSLLLWLSLLLLWLVISQKHRIKLKVRVSEWVSGRSSAIPSSPPGVLIVSQFLGTERRGRRLSYCTVPVPSWFLASLVLSWRKGGRHTLCAISSWRHCAASSRRFRFGWKWKMGELFRFFLHHLSGLFGYIIQLSLYSLYCLSSFLWKEERHLAPTISI